MKQVSIRVGNRTVTASPTLTDRVVSWVNPLAGIDRMRARLMLSAASTSGGFIGGRRDRRTTRNWRPKQTSANADLTPDLPDLRARSRDLGRNTPLATGAIATVVTNVVGDGLSVAPAIDRKVLGLTDEQAEAFEDLAAKEFALWGDGADFTGVQTFGEMQALVLRAVLESGDVLALRRFRKRPGEAYGTRVQLVEADRLSNKGRRADTANQIAGVKFDDDGLVTAYEIANRHPDDYLPGAKVLEWTEVPARDTAGRRLVLHIFERLRPDQARGMPYLAPVIETLKKLGDYSEAEATAALVNAMFTVFITTPDAGDDETQAPVGTVVSSAPSDKPQVELGPGAIIGLQDGEKPEFANPNRPNVAFDAFITSIMRQVGAALELPYEVLTKHFTASYSASRAALETAWQMYRKRRHWLARRFCQPCYEFAIDEAVASGRLTARGYFRDPLIRKAWLGTTWNGPARISLDQAKDAKADETYLKLGVTTRERIIQERQGGTFEQTVAQRAKEKRALDGAGLTPPPPVAPPQSGGDTDQPPAPGGDGGRGDETEDAA